MKATSLKTCIAGVMIAFLGFACGKETGSGQTFDTSAAATPASTATTCPAPRLDPSYIPPGFETVAEPALIENSEWSNTWKSSDRLFQVLGGFSADRGDDSTTKSATVRGRGAQLGPVALQSGAYTAVNWDEESDCGLHQYAVIGRGVSDQQLLQIADSLTETDGSVTDRY
jgi:hypothetical protein